MRLKYLNVLFLFIPGNKHKMERFLPQEGIVVATFFAQILFPPANVLVFREKGGAVHFHTSVWFYRILYITGDILPIASGSLFSVNPDRVITKRIVLSGHPFRINKRSATVRYMFFNRGKIYTDHWPNMHCCSYTFCSPGLLLPALILH